MALLFQSRYFK